MAMPIVSENVYNLVRENLAPTIMSSLIVRIKRENPAFANAIEKYAEESRSVGGEQMEIGVGLGAFLAYALLEIQQKVDEEKQAVA